MFAEEKDIIEETMRLAAERETAREAYEAEHGPKKWGVYLPEEKALNDYLIPRIVFIPLIVWFCNMVIVTFRRFELCRLIWVFLQ